MLANSSRHAFNASNQVAYIIRMAIVSIPICALSRYFYKWINPSGDTTFKLASESMLSVNCCRTYCIIKVCRRTGVDMACDTTPLSSKFRAGIEPDRHLADGSTLNCTNFDASATFWILRYYMKRASMKTILRKQDRVIDVLQDTGVTCFWSY